jgi:hypothetical protein
MNLNAEKAIFVRLTRLYLIYEMTLSPFEFSRGVIISKGMAYNSRSLSKLRH